VQVDPVFNGHFNRFVRQATFLRLSSPDDGADPAKVN
jgi:hypothetical protein